MPLEVDPELPRRHPRARIGGVTRARVETGRPGHDAVPAGAAETTGQERLGHRAADDVPAADVQDAAHGPRLGVRRSLGQPQGAPEAESPVDENLPGRETPVRPHDRTQTFGQPRHRRPPEMDPPPGPPGARSGAGAPDRLFAESLELARDLGPSEALLDKSPSRRPDGAAPRGVAQKCRHGLREVLRLVGPQEVPARDQRQPLGAHGRRHDRLSRRQRLEDLQPRAAADPERHDIDVRFREVRAHVRDRPGDARARLGGRGSQPRRRVAPDHRKRRPRHAAPDARQDRLQEVQHGVFVGIPVHRAGEDE